jgi:hypothetical protein
MIENSIRDFLVQNLLDLTNQNCFAGKAPDTAPATYCVVKKQSSPLADSHNTIAGKLRTPVGIGEQSASLSIEVQGDDYQEAATLINEIFTALGGEDGGCVNLTNKQVYIIPVQSPFQEEDVLKFNFIVRTKK